MLAGGLTARKQILEQFLLPEMKGGLRLLFNEKPQICGAAVGGARVLGITDPEFKETFYQNYKKMLEDEYHVENGNA